MKVIIFTSNHLRHKFFANYLSLKHEIIAIFSEDKGDQGAYGGHDSELKSHFNRRKETEEKFFSGYKNWPNSIKIFNLKRSEINSSKIINQIKRLKHEEVVVFGCGILKPETIDVCSPLIINAHQGLSPYYRGSGTNFWPFYNEEPEYVGVTIHYIDIGIDTGGIICHGRPDIAKGDSQHDIGCKTIEISAKLVSKVLDILEKKKIPGIPQWEKGKLYRRKDFNPNAVKKVLDLFKNGLIDKYIERKRKGEAFIRLISVEDIRI